LSSEALQPLWDVRDVPPLALRPLFRQATKDAEDLVFRGVPVDLSLHSGPEYGVALRQLIVVHGVSPLLGLRVEAGESIGDAAFSAWLSKELGYNRERLGRIKGMLDELLPQFARRGIEVVPPKGCALLLDGVEQLAWRTIGDIDLLVGSAPSRELDLAVAHAGYCLTRTSWKHREYGLCTPPPWSPNVLDGSRDFPIMLELHPRVGEYFRGSRWDITAQIRAGLVTRNGVTTPGDRAMALHLAAHASIAMLEGFGRLVHIVDLDRALQRVGAAELVTAVSRTGLRHCARFVYPSVALVARETGNPTAAEIADMLRPHVPPGMVRWAESVSLYDISYLGQVERRPFDRTTLWAMTPGDRTRMVAATLAPSPSTIGSERYTGEGLPAVARMYPRYYAGLLLRMWETVRPRREA
jgi:hypothetical protein